MRPHITDRYWFPKKDLNMIAVNQFYTVDLDMVDEEGYDILLECYKEKWIQGKKWIGLPKGNSRLVKDCLVSRKRFKDLVDKQSYVVAKNIHKLKFLGKLSKKQKKAIKRMADVKRGILVSGARTGKTIMGTQVAIEIGMKTLILAHQTDLIEQFCNETINDKKEKLFNGISFKKKIAGICHSIEDFDKYDICLATYQTFLSKGGKKKLKYIRDKFGLVIIDEVHRTPALRYSQVISHLYAPYIIGLTATPKRKDGRHCQVANTKVLMADGTLKNIQDIKVNDKVLSYNHDKRKLEPGLVTKTIKHRPREVYKVSHQEGCIIATQDHKVYVNNKDKYVMVRDLEKNDSFIVNNKF